MGKDSCIVEGSPEKQNQQDVYVWKELQFKPKGSLLAEFPLA